MHELSLAGGILRIVEDAAQRERFTRVAALRLEIGALAGVELSALQFALTALGPGTVLEGCELQFERTVGRAFCFGCGANVELTELGAACPECGAQRLQAISGTELRVLELVVRDR